MRVLPDDTNNNKISHLLRQGATATITGSAGSQTATLPPNYETSVELVRFRSFTFIVQDFEFWIPHFFSVNYRTMHTISDQLQPHLSE